MPLFFIVSGLLYKDRRISIVIKNGVKRYLLPACCFVLFDFVRKMGVLIITHSEMPDILTIIKTFTICGGMVTNSPIWFLPCLFMCVLAMSFTQNKPFIRIVILIGCIISCCAFDLTRVSLVWPFSFLAAYPFFYLGTRLKNEMIDKKMCIEPNNRIYFFILFAVTVLTSLFNGITEIALISFGKSYFLFLLTSVSGFMCVYYVAKAISNSRVSKPLSKIGQDTMLIFLTHYYLCRGLIKKMFSLLGLEAYQYNVMVELLLTLIITTIYYLIINMYRRGNDNCNE